MKLKGLPFFLAAALCVGMVGCSAPTQDESTSSGAVSASGSSSLVEEPDSSVEQPGNSNAELGEMEIDPPYDFDPDAMEAKDFGDYFTASYSDCQRTTYPILEDSDYENEVTQITGAEEGAVIYVIAGVHGDEEAAWRTGNLLKKIDIKAGTLYVLSPANPWGAEQEPRTRYVTGEEDLNRCFPGDPSGSAAQQVAAAIMADVERVQPDFVFDLHEARIVKSSQDFLGSSLIFTSMEGMEELFMNMVMATEMGELCSEPFKYYSPGPEGSVNRTITEQLGVPTITVETFRGYEMEQRIGDQLAVVQYVLKDYGLVE